MENNRVYLVGCLLQGMAQRSGLTFGMAEEAVLVADAALMGMGEAGLRGEWKAAPQVQDVSSDYK